MFAKLDWNPFCVRKTFRVTQIQDYFVTSHEYLNPWLMMVMVVVMVLVIVMVLVLVMVLVMVMVVVVVVAFFLAWEDLWRMFDHSFPACAFFFQSGN